MSAGGFTLIFRSVYRLREEVQRAHMSWVGWAGDDLPCVPFGPVGEQ